MREYMKIMEQLVTANAKNVLLESDTVDEARGPLPKAFDPEELRKVKELRDQGLPAREIASELGMDDGKVNVLLKHVDSEVVAPRGENMGRALLPSDGEVMKNKLLNKEATLRALAREYQTDVNTVRKLIIKSGLTSDEIKKLTSREGIDTTGGKLDANKVQVASQLWAEGVTVKEIAAALEVDNKSLSTQIKKLPNFEELRQQHNANIENEENRKRTGRNDVDADPNAPARAPRQAAWRDLPEPVKQTILTQYKRGVDPDSIAWDLEKAGNNVGRGTVNSFIDHQPNAVELKQDHVVARRKRVRYNA